MSPPIRHDDPPTSCRRRVLDPIRMRRQHRAARTDFEDVGVRAAIEGLRGERMGDGDQGHVRLLAKGEAKPEGPVRGQVADEDVRQRLAVSVLFLVRASPNRLPVALLAVRPSLIVGVAALDGFAACRFSGSGCSSSARMKPRSIRASPSWESTTNTPPRAMSSGS